MEKVSLQGPSSRATSRTKNRTIPGAITMVGNSLATVLLWLGVVLAAAAILAVGAQDRNYLVGITCCRSLGYEFLLATTASQEGQERAHP